MKGAMHACVLMSAPMSQPGITHFHTPALQVRTEVSKHPNQVSVTLILESFSQIS